MTVEIEPAKDTIYFRSANDLYKKVVDYAPDVLATDENGLYITYSEDGELAYIVSRADGPAIDEQVHSRQRFIYNGRLHRPDGPAFVQNETSDYSTDEMYFVFGLELSKIEFERHRAFIQRAHNYVVEHNMALEEFDGLQTNEQIVTSFESPDSFFLAAKTNSITVVSGMRDCRTTKTVDLGGSSSLGVGVAAVAILGGLGLIASRRKAQRQTTSQNKVTEAVNAIQSK